MTEDAIADTNEVTLTGRLSAVPEHRDLPSGDVLLSFRLVVRRPQAERGSVDSIECTTTRRRLHRSLAGMAAGQRLQVSGALRRRFWQGPAGVQSRYSVDVSGVRRLAG